MINDIIKAGASFKMFPPCALVLFFFVLFLLRFPLCKLPLSFLALEKGLYLWEQGQGQDQDSVLILSCYLLPCPQRI